MAHDAWVIYFRLLGAGMTSDSDDLEQQLQENLKLRRELASAVSKDSSANQGQRVSRGFHRFAVFLAVFAFLAAATVTILIVIEKHDALHSLGAGAINGLIVGLVVYGLVRAVGWVIGGFAAS